MSKKNSIVLNHKNCFSRSEQILKIFLNFKTKLLKLKTNKFLVAVSGTSMEEASEAKEAGDKVVSEEQFMATHMLAEQAANHTKVFNTFCD